MTHEIPDKSSLLEMYAVDKMSLYDIAEYYDVAHETVRRWMLKYNIGRRSIAEGMSVYVMKPKRKELIGKIKR